MRVFDLFDGVRLLDDGPEGEAIDLWASDLSRELRIRLEVEAEFRALVPLGWDEAALHTANKQRRFWSYGWWDRQRWKHAAGPERDALLVHSRSRWARMSEDERQRHSALCAEGERRRRAQETSDETTVRRARKAQYDRERVERETPEERESRLARRREVCARYRRRKGMAKRVMRAKP